MWIIYNEVTLDFCLAIVVPEAKEQKTTSIIIVVK
jgi:hypothetical protein